MFTTIAVAASCNQLSATSRGGDPRTALALAVGYRMTGDSGRFAPASGTLTIAGVNQECLNRCFAQDGYNQHHLGGSYQFPGATEDSG